MQYLQQEKRLANNTKNHPAYVHRHEKPIDLKDLVASNYLVLFGPLILYLQYSKLILCYHESKHTKRNVSHLVK